MSEMTRGHGGSTACAPAKMTFFPFPSGDGQSNEITVGIVDGCPPNDGTFFSFAGPVITMQVGRPAVIRQRREDQSHAWTWVRGDLSLIPGLFAMVERIGFGKKKEKVPTAEPVPARAASAGAH